MQALYQTRVHVLCIRRNMSNSTWKSFPCSRVELNLGMTLNCGQSFRWREHRPGEWTGVMKGLVWVFKQTDSEIFYKTFRKSPKDTPESDYRLIQDYFQLDVTLTELYENWSKADAHFSKISPNFKGIRMLRQDPLENTFSFICSSNNHISRISSMIEKMCKQYGESIAEVDGETYYAFPTVQSLAKKGVEDKLRALGFGYRAKYISKSAKMIEDKGGIDWLNNLRTLPYPESKRQLMQLCGVGAKVADCVCLMSLDKTGAIPVDTHVWQIAARDYMPKLKQCKSLTDTLYSEIGDGFRTLWGEYAGWAHSVLFTADLKKFKNVSPARDKLGDNCVESKSDSTNIDTVQSIKKEPSEKIELPEDDEISKLDNGNRHIGTNSKRPNKPLSRKTKKAKKK